MDFEIWKTTMTQNKFDPVIDYLADRSIHGLILKPNLDEEVVKIGQHFRRDQSRNLSI